ncbi:hypothetical protein J7M02_05470 [Candidatus Aerophobetes bacterium]|nr:hypothetical protein [Candidatus Aerophobetes bacterium]
MAFVMQLIHISKKIENDSLPKITRTSLRKSQIKFFRDNALKKARAIAKLTGKIALADDSGLEIESFGEALGIFLFQVCWGEGFVRVVSVMLIKSGMGKRGLKRDDKLFREKL